MSDGGKLSGKVAIVTGAGSQTSGIGNGRASAILIARQGARVALLDRSLEAAERTASLIEDELGAEIALPLACDVTREQDCAAAVASAIDCWGRVDILVNNVGIYGARGTAVTIDLAEWDQGLRTNLTSMVLMAKYAIPEIEKQGGGAIVNIGSIGGLLGGYGHLLYPTSKGAIVNLTRAMAAHHGPRGIRVNSVAPGSVYTPFAEEHGMTPELREERANSSLLRTEGTAWDIGNAVVFLVTDDSRWITGVTLPVDGGMTAARTHPPRPAKADWQ
jgi:NAD(P)-dependent dehydrogenase (short-subunit alcohol dehydrogenase family)